MNRAAISIGSNIHPQANVTAALTQLARRLSLLKQSQFLVTRPIGRNDQADFLNGVVLVETPMDRPTLEQWLKDVEVSLGRPRGGDRHGPRTIDLDVVVWNSQVVHNDVYRRDFLQRQLREVLPDFHLPGATPPNNTPEP